MVCQAQDLAVAVQAAINLAQAQEAAGALAVPAAVVHQTEGAVMAVQESTPAARVEQVQGRVTLVEPVVQVVQVVAATGRQLTPAGVVASAGPLREMILALACSPIPAIQAVISAPRPARLLPPTLRLATPSTLPLATSFSARPTIVGEGSTRCCWSAATIA